MKYITTSLLFFVAMAAIFPAFAMRPKTVYLVQHTHSDIGYARPQYEILAHYAEQIEKALDYCEATADYPEEAQFRWTCEIAASVLNFLESRPSEEVERFLHWVRKGNIEVAGLFLNSGEMCDESAWFHQLRELRQLRERGIPLRLCMQNDVNGLAWCLADHASDLGLKYTWMGENSGRALIPFKEPTVYRWQSPSGREMLAFRSEHYMTGNMWGIHEGDTVKFASKMNALLDRLEKAGYPFDAIGIPYAGFPTDDSAPCVQECDFIRRWNADNPEVKLVSATASMFLDHVSKDPAVSKLAVHRAAYPDWWSDGFGTYARDTGEALYAQRELGAAEGVMAMSLLQGTSLPSALAPLVADTRLQLAYWGEHTAGDHRAIRDPFHWDTHSGWAGKQAFAWTARRDARRAAESAAALLRPELARDRDHALLTLYNPLPWTRDGFAETYIDFGVIPRTSGFRFVDEQGVELQALRLRAESGAGAVYRIFARALPPCGYRTYRIEVGGRERRSGAVAVLENEFYRIEIDPRAGVVTNLFDKVARRQLVDAAAPHRLGEIVYETFSDRRKIDHLPKFKPGRSGFAHKGCRNFKAAGSVSNALYDSLRFTADFPEAGASDFSIEVRLMRGRPAIELAYSLRRTKSDVLSSFYVAFPFTGRKLAFDVPGGLVRPGENQLEGTSSAWNVVQNFVAAEDGDFRILLSPSSTPLVQLGRLFCDHPFEYIKTYDKPYVYVWPMNNYWWTNFRHAQDGDFKWSYQLTSRLGGGEEGAFRWAQAERTPLLAHVQPRGPERVRPRTWRGLELTSASLVTSVVTPALDGKGVVMVVGERSGKAATLALKGPDGQPLRFRRIDILERPLGAFCTELPVKPFENLTVYVEAPTTTKVGDTVAPSPRPVKKSCRFIRFKVEEIKGVCDGTQVSELELYENGKSLRGEIVRTFADETVTDDKGHKYIGHQSPAQAVDGVLISKWFDYRGSTDCPPSVREATWMGLEFKRPVTVTGYAWTTAEDYIPRDPSSWRLQGSDDGKTWTDLHVVRGFRATDMRNVRAYEISW